MDTTLPETGTTSGKPRKFLRNFLISVGVIVFLVAAGTAVYFYMQYTKLNHNPSQQASADTQETIAAVGRLIVLPDNEQPTVATVTDPSKLGNQSFFANAKVGDKVLLYAQAQKAILYDPSIDKIVEVAPIDLSAQNAPNVSGTTDASQ
ncbi:MAG TPA: hypothetical protein VFX17_00010 [Patescibacteria group bacterium]|nr:hypothetical protein [Patescibacteria group bacterium]